MSDFHTFRYGLFFGVGDTFFKVFLLNRFELALVCGFHFRGITIVGGYLRNLRLRFHHGRTRRHKIVIHSRRLKSLLFCCGLFLTACRVHTLFYLSFWAENIAKLLSHIQGNWHIFLLKLIFVEMLLLDYIAFFELIFDRFLTLSNFAASHCPPSVWWVFFQVLILVPLIH